MYSQPAVSAAATLAQRAALRAMKKADVIEGAARAFAVLEAFSADRQRLNATQVAVKAGLTRAAARRHLLTLHALGYLERDHADALEGKNSGNYWLGPRVLRLAGNYLASARLPRSVQPALNRLTASTDAAFSVALLDEDAVVIVARSGEHRPAAGATPYGSQLGARLPAFATSTGRVLLAAMGRAERVAWLRGRTLARLTAHTVCDRVGLNALLKQVALQGYCIATQEHELGVAALAVPLRDRAGTVVAALNVVVASAQLDIPLATQYLQAMQLAASEIRILL